MADADRERLIEILKLGSCPSPYLCDENCKYANLERCYEERTADLLLKHGVVLLPCKVGDRVYRPSDCLGVVQFIIISFNIYESEMFFTDDSENIIYLSDIGKTVFLTREEAERALKEREDNG